MKRFFSRLFRFFWSWGFLKFVLVAITFVVLLYVEENWRGARAWAATKAKWEARGVSFDFNAYLTPPVPDEQNLAALPLFKLEPDPDPDPQEHGNPVPLALRRAFAHNTDAHLLMVASDWQHGKPSDIDKLREQVAAQYAATFPGRVPPASAAEQFAELYPVVAELREASAARPLCRFEQNYEFNSREKNGLGLIIEQIKISKFLTWDALLALDAHDPGCALDDIKLNNKLARGMIDEPILVSGLVAVGMVAINLSAVYDGLAAHAWSDAHLAEIEADLGRLNFLGDYHRLMRGEAVGVLIPSLDKIKAEWSEWLPNKTDGTLYKDYFPSLYASGWLDLWKARSVDLDFTASTWADPEARQFLPKAEADFQSETERALDRWMIYLPWNWLMRMGATGAVFNAPNKFAQMQVWVDEARIACALERYRLAHGTYPAALDALAPEFIEAVPHDVMSGEAYRYRLKGDGTFLLYSVGWNQRDDGGVEAKKDSGGRDYAKGDWVWPMMKR